MTRTDKLGTAEGRTNQNTERMRQDEGKPPSGDHRGKTCEDTERVPQRKGKRKESDRVGEFTH